MNTAPFAPGDTVVVVPPPEGKIRLFQCTPPLQPGSVWTVADCIPAHVYHKATGVFFSSDSMWAVFLVGVKHPPWTHDPSKPVGYSHTIFRKAVATDIAVFRDMLAPSPWREPAKPA